MTSDFRNAYHFVPREPKGVADQQRDLPTAQKDFGLRPGHEVEGHAVYAPGAHSGRITCRITLECPTIIGGKRTAGEAKTAPAYVAPFLFRDRPAIPASSVKGMLSAVAEAASRAPYRVLTDMNLTVAYIAMEDGKRFSVRHQNIEGKRKVNPKDLSKDPLIGTTYDYVDEPLRPLRIQNGELTRSHVNPVESLFGFVAEAKPGQKKPGRDKVTSAAGKLRVSHALPSADWATTPTAAFFLDGDIDKLVDGVPRGVKLTLLKEQGEPMKQPKRQDDHIKQAGPQPKDYDELNSATPNFYFVERDQPEKFISKETFATTDPKTYRIQGGKAYLHNPESAAQDLTRSPWKSAGPKTGDGVERKAAAAILQRGVSFDFHIDFDNLTDHELNILCFALRPSTRFRHKIGLGKALGLGSIRIDVQDLVLIDRHARYTATALFQDDPRSTADGSGTAIAADRAAQHSAWLETNDKGAKRALLQIGETHVFDRTAPPEALRDAETPVLWVPLTDERFQAYTDRHLVAEQESFQWFTLADRVKQQKLRPIGEGRLPKLKTMIETRPGKTQVYPPPSRNRAATVPPKSEASGTSAKGDRIGQVTKIRADKNGQLICFVMEEDDPQGHFVSPSVLKDSKLSKDDLPARVAFRLKPPSPDDKNGRPPVAWLKRL